MIFDRLLNASQYYVLGNRIKQGFEFLKDTDLKNIEEGRHEIKGDEIFANVQSLTTKPQESAKWEVHRKYIDIQYLIKGEEKMGYGILEDFGTIVTPYDSEKDIAFLFGNHYNFINVSQGDFVMFYPNDVHAPMLCTNKPQVIKKVIVKIAI